MPARRILVVAYYHPPSTSIGGARWHAMARHLRDLGHEVTVITSVANGPAQPDDGDRVIRTADLVASERLRRVLRRPSLAEAGGTVTATTAAPGLVTRTLVPDAYAATWAPSALRAARRLVRERAIECVVTTGPPSSAHLVALALGRARPAWIADLRDGWTFEPLEEPWPTAAQRALDARVERLVMRRSDAAIGVTRPIAEDLERRLGAHARWIPNGWDPRVQPAATPPDVAEPGWTTLVHTGRLSGSASRDPRALFEAVRRVNAAGGARVRLVLCGSRTALDDELIAGADVGDAVLHLGLLDRAAALGLQRSADALLLLTGPHRSEATGKLYEYLAAGRPIVALAEGNEAARIVADTGTGIAVPPFDADAIAQALRAVVRGEIPYAPRGLERFTYPGPAEAVAELVEEAIARRGAR